MQRSDGKHMWEEVKQTVLCSGREVCGSVVVWMRNLNNNENKVAIGRRKYGWKTVLE